MHCWWERKMVQPLRKTFWQILKRRNLQLLYDPAISPLDTYPKKRKADTQTDICTRTFMVALFTIAKR